MIESVFDSEISGEKGTGSRPSFPRLHQRALGWGRVMRGITSVCVGPIFTRPRPGPRALLHANQSVILWGEEIGIRILEKIKIKYSSATRKEKKQKEKLRTAVPGCGAVDWTPPSPDHQQPIGPSAVAASNRPSRRRRRRPPPPPPSAGAVSPKDEKKVNEVSSMADEWNLPSLVSSVYATPLFRRGLEPINFPGFGDVSNDQPGIFVSDGFVFPPSEHENLPIEPDVNELNSNDNSKEGSCAGSNDEWCYVTPEEVDDISAENLSVSGDLPSANGTTYPDSKTPVVHTQQEKDHITGNSDLPCGGWWKRKTSYIFHHIKGVTTVCSVVAAGAVVGFVVMGQRFQQDNWRFHQIHLSVSSENMSRVIGLFSRLKDGLPGGQQLRSLLPTRLLPPQQMSA